jgi:hypothetical protein
MELELDQDRMTRVMDAIAQNEVTIARLEAIIRASVRVDPLQVDAATCTAEDFTTSDKRQSSSDDAGDGMPQGFARASLMDGDVGSFLTRPHIGLLQLHLALEKETRLLTEERATYSQSVQRLQLAAVELKKSVAEA